ncbi:MAG: OmpA family protein [Caulobacterales bacterium]
MNTEDGPRSLFLGGIVVAIVAALVGLLGPHGGSIWRLPQNLQVSVEQALKAAGAGGLEVNMEGQRAVLAGIVGSEADIAAAQRAALSAAGPGGAWAGGVSSADVSGVSVGEAEHPFEWRARKADNKVTLSGAAPSQDAREALLEHARANFQTGDVIDNMHVAGGAPSGRWRYLAFDALDQLSKLAKGEARFSDERIVVLGEGDRAAVESVRAFYDQTMPEPYRARAEVSVAGEPLAIPELADLDLSDAQPQVCEQAFQRLMAQNVINFASGSAELERSSLPLLDNLASIALRCDRYNIEIAGHTDNQGARDINLDLSRRRAEAVVNYLASLIVSRERLRAVGYGADRPVSSNTTAAGQAANRRIVFSVQG